MSEHVAYPERTIRRFGPRERFTPRHRALHEVHITKSLGPERTKHIMTFIRKRIAAFGGVVADRHGIPQMLFERRQDAQRFANQLSARLNIHSEHIIVRAGRSERPAS